jgi:hypothetical protein
VKAKQSKRCTLEDFDDFFSDAVEGSGYIRIKGVGGRLAFSVKNLRKDGLLCGSFEPG